MPLSVNMCQSSFLVLVGNGRNFQQNWLELRAKLVGNGRKWWEFGGRGGLPWLEKILNIAPFKCLHFQISNMSFPPKQNLQISFPSQKLSSPGKKMINFPSGKSDPKFPFLPKGLGRNDTMFIQDSSMLYSHVLEATIQLESLILMRLK